MPVRYSRHLEDRIRIRRLPSDLPRQIYEEAEEHFQNSHTGFKIAVKHVLLYGREREVMVAYHEKDDDLVLVTIHPLKEGQKGKSPCQWEVAPFMKEGLRTFYDPEEDVLYLAKEGEEEETAEVHPNVNLELNKDGEIIGIEVLHASQVLKDVLEGLRQVAAG